MSLERIVEKLHSAYKGAEKFVKYEAALIAAEPAGLAGRIAAGRIGSAFTDASSSIASYTLIGDYVGYNGAFILIYYLADRGVYKGNTKKFVSDILRKFIVPDTPFMFVDYAPTWPLTKALLDHGWSTDWAATVAYIAGSITYHSAMQAYRHFIVEKDIDKKIAKKGIEIAKGVTHRIMHGREKSKTFKNSDDYSGHDSPVV